VHVVAYEPTPFRRAILHVLDRAGSVPMTRLHKLLYLADLEFYLENGRTLTGAPWVRQKYGPMTKAMLPSLANMASHEIEEEQIPTQKGRQVHLIKKGPSPRYAAALDRDEAETLDRILEMTARLSDDDVVRLAYSTTPMLLIEARERHEGVKLLDTPIDFGRMTEPADLELAQEREPDLEARAVAQREAMAAMAPYVARALSGPGS
jgi:hypothetical protein